MINREEVFQEIQKGNWEYMINVLHLNKKDINSDPILNIAAKTFISEFLSNIDSYPDDREDIVSYLEKLFMIHNGNFFKIDDVNHRKIICQIVKRKSNQPEEAYNYALTYPQEKICFQVIEKYEMSIPKVVQHNQSDKILVTESRGIANIDFTSNLFKSNQEYDFFKALKMTFDSYQIYPNVAISCLLDWELLKGELTHEESDYYFKGVVDCVVFDQALGFKPIYFFELDSIFHDKKEVKFKDSLKDSIFAKAGQKILRIRKRDNDVNEQTFIKLIRELIK